MTTEGAGQPTADLQFLTLGRGVRAAAARAPKKPAIIFGERVLRYCDLVERMARLATVAQTRWKLSPGDRVALVAPNCLEYLEIVLGLSDLGVVVATLNPRLTKGELAAIFADCMPRVLFVDPALEALVDPTAARELSLVRLGSDYERLLEGAAGTPVLPRVPDWAPFALAYTSGTTGQPKGVLLPHRSRALTFLSMAAEYDCFGPDDHFLALAPLCHGAGFVFAAAPISLGGSVTILAGFEPDDVLSRLSSGRHTGVFMVPTHLHRIFTLEPRVLARHKLQGVKSLISNAAALPQAIKESVVATFGAGLLHETYGSTEGGIVTNIRPSDLLRKPGSVGTPFPLVEIEIRDEAGRAMGPGTIGELFSRGPYSFNGYWNRPGETAEALRQGWVTVGDMAVRDTDGYITIVDRKKDLVITGGVNVYPREIETVIAKVPGVREVAVVGLPDAEWGERLHAFVVPEERIAVDITAILAACRAELAGFKVPRGVSFLTELPRNAGGKILKKELRALSAAG